MFGKFFAQTFTGSMFGAGAVVFAVWSYIIANKDENGVVELNANLLAGIIGCDPKEIEEAIEFLASPDEESRSEKEGGRRITQEGRFLWLVVNNEEYKEIARKEHLREYNRLKQAERRERLRQEDVKVQCTGVNTSYRHEEGRDKREEKDEETSFGHFWTQWPRKVKKKTAFTAWKNMTKKNRQAALDALPAHLVEWQGKDKQFIPHPATWLRAESWNDDLEPFDGNVSAHKGRYNLDGTRKDDDQF